MKIIRLSWLCLGLACLLSACQSTRPHPLNITNAQVKDQMLAESGDHDRPYNLRVHYPKLTSYPDPQGAQVLNQKIQQFIGVVMDDFKAHVPVDNDDLRDYPKEMRVNALDVKYLSYLEKKNGHYWLSLRFEIKTLYMGQDIPKYQYAVLNENVTQQQPVKLPDLFVEDSDYLDRISTYCNKNLSEQMNLNMPWMPNTDGTTPKLRNYRIWNIRNNGLMFTFNDTQMEPYANKTMTVTVPFRVLSPVLKPGSPFRAEDV